MVSLYFGLPGCGKTTLIAKMCKKAMHSKRYEYVYSNVDLDMPGYYKVDFKDLGKYNIHNGLVLLDEATIGISNRSFKDTPKYIVDWYLMHRHYNVDVLLFTQRWDGIDKTIRTITDRVYYVYKPFLTGLLWTKYYRIPYDIIIPDPNKAGSGEKLGEIVQGYCKPGLIGRLFCGRCFRPLYYKYFNSWDAPALPDLPADRMYKGNVLEIKGKSRQKVQDGEYSMQEKASPC